MGNIFQFKQFSVDQTGCAMKINTDGVLLGALTEAKNPESILDIGTGTGVIALMLAQRFTSAQIDAVEIDAVAANTAAMNFKNSSFAGRLEVFPLAIEDFFDKHPGRRYDLIVSNPPFHINSLLSPKAKKSLAKHTGDMFFEELISGVAQHLATGGLFWLILPLEAAELVKGLAAKAGLYLRSKISIYSFEDSEPHREILVFGSENIETEISRFVIYAEVNVYSAEYKQILKPYFIAF